MEFRLGPRIQRGCGVPVWNADYLNHATVGSAMGHARVIDSDSPFMPGYRNSLPATACLGGPLWHGSSPPNRLFRHEVGR